jgi:hypothetical protein
MSQCFQRDAGASQAIEGFENFAVCTFSEARDEFETLMRFE